jgi:hypothetical protein
VSIDDLLDEFASNATERYADMVVAERIDQPRMP